MYKYLKHFIADPLLVYPCFNYNCLCLQVNPIVGHLNFLLYDWKREVNHPLIKTPQKKIQLMYMTYRKKYCH